MAVQLSALRSRARVLADQDDASFPTDAQYLQYLNAAQKDVWYDLVTAGWPVQYATATVTATGATQYLLASGAGIFSVRSVWRVEGTRRTPVERVDESTKAAQLSAPLNAASASYEVLVDPTGTVIRFFPLVSGTFEVEYIAEPVDFSADADYWRGPMRSDELIVLRAAAKGCRKEGRRGDAADLLSDYKELLEKVKDSASWVDQRNTPRIRDVMGSQRRDPFDYPIY
jgi:hypothetical protein